MLYVIIFSKATVSLFCQVNAFIEEKKIREVKYFPFIKQKTEHIHTELDTNPNV